MNKRALKKLGVELGEFIDSIVFGMGRAERREALSSYITGLLLDGERKSVEPIAARLVDNKSEIEAMRQRLLQAVNVAKWPEQEVFSRLAVKLDNELPGVEAFVVDDTGFAKKGAHSVGVHRQYSGTLARVGNCQVAVSLHLAGDRGSGCVGFRLFLPEAWTSDLPRRTKAGVPDSVTFKTKPEIALGLIDEALATGIRRHTVLADAGYGDSTSFRDGLADRGLQYVVAINGEPVLWPPGSNPRIPRKRRHGDRPNRYRDDANPPLKAKELAETLRYRKVTWREGTKGRQAAPFAAVRVRTAHRHTVGEPPGEEVWLVCEQREHEKRPYRYWLSNLPPRTSLRALVRLAKLRWRVERDYQDLKGEVGLDHYEGRSWRGFHHHAALCCAAHAFLALRRALFPPEHGDALAACSAPNPAAGAATPDPALPAVPPDCQRPGAAGRSVAHVIE